MKREASPVAAAHGPGDPGRFAHGTVPRMVADEMLLRLRHVEMKVDQALQMLAAGAPEVSGHADQAFGGRTYAQFGEDLILLNLFHALGMPHPSYLDVGAHHPFNVSNTALLYMRGSRGINVEANPNLVEAFRRARPDDVTLNLGVGPRRGTLPFYFIDDWSGRNTFDHASAKAFVRENPTFRIQNVHNVEVVTLHDIVDRHAGGRFPDLLSLDVEGWDRAILEATSFDRTRPVAICVEAVSGADSDDSARLTQLLIDRGYRLYARTVGNLIFVEAAAAAASGKNVLF